MAQSKNLTVGSSSFLGARIELQIPDFEVQPDQVQRNVLAIIEKSRRVVDTIKKQDKGRATFESTLQALDDLRFEENSVMSRVHLLQNVSPDEALRKTSQQMVIEFQDWAIEKAYDPELYSVIKAYAQKKENLEGEEKKLLEETMRDYRRLGLELPQEKQARLQEIQKRLSAIETQFASYINEYQDEVEVAREELDGLDEEFIRNLKRSASGKYRISLQYPEYLPVMEFCKSEEVRRALLTKKYNTAHSTNPQLLNEMITLRDEMAEILGYTSFNHYVIEERMAKTPERVQKFLSEFRDRLNPKARDELESLRKLKAEKTNNPKAEFCIWDYYFYSSLYKKMHYEIDTRSLREFFPLNHVLPGMFSLIQQLFGLRFEEQAANSFYRWHENVRLFKVWDAEKNEELGAFYLDLFPRKGKYSHAAAFTIQEGKFLPKENVYRRPVAAMVCNFSEVSPSLLPHSEVETLFHEFGHILHNLISKTKFARFAGTNVAWDFVEAPSQVLENWVWDYEILQMISKHSSNPKKKIERDFVKNMNEARKAGTGLFYLRQLAFAEADLRFHSKGRPKDSNSIMQDTLREIFLAAPEGTSFAAGWGHMTGYASGYYGYAWADVMAADIFAVFREKGLLSTEVGRKLRHEIYEPGSSRDENESLEKFLGRPLSSNSFFKELGLPI